MKEIELDELERILANEEELQPMTGFSTRVMRAVREEAAAVQPMPFPWVRILPGFVLSLGLLLGAAVWLVLGVGSSSLSEPLRATWLLDSQAQGLLWAALTVFGSGALAWIVVRWAAPRRGLSF